RDPRSAGNIASPLHAGAPFELSGTCLATRPQRTSRRRRSPRPCRPRAPRERGAARSHPAARSRPHGPGGARVKALVTGASGFIGGAVARALLRRGDHVRVLLRPGTVPNLAEAGEVEISRGDLRDADAVAS